MTDLTYKCHTLTINELPNFRNSAEKLYRKVAANMQADFEEYIDELEKSAKLYCQLTGKELSIDLSW